MKNYCCFFFFLFIACGVVQARDLRSDTIDIVSYRLNLDLTDFTGKILHAEATMGIKSKMNGVGSIRLDLLDLTVDSVIVNAYHTLYAYNDTILSVNLLTTLNTGDSATIQVYYHGHPLHSPGDFGGFYWTGTYAFNIGVSFLSDPHNYGRVWFPCFDNFETRSYYEFYVTTKSTHKAFCNGILQGVTSSGNQKTWHWKLGQSIPSYLASVAVADYATVEDTVHAINGTIPIELAAQAGDTTTLKNLFVHLHDAFHILENLWGPYRWDRVGYCIVPFNAGAMEHATNISFMNYYLNVYSGEAETTMAHELSHHWFGDLVTCDSAADMWLNEGWARYNEFLFLENLYGDSAYRSAVRVNHEDVLHHAHISDGSYLPVSGVPTAYTYGKTVYDKGADAIHSLRFYMGDSLFFHCVRAYLNQYRWQTASTAQLCDFLSQCSGIDLTDYFNDWIYSPGFPHFSLERIEPSGTPNDYRMIIQQRLSHAPHLYYNVPLTVSMFTGDGLSWTRYDTTVLVSGACTSFDWTNTSNEPLQYVALDFDDHIQDAITDEWKIISDTGTYDFGTAKMILQVRANSDSSLVRVLHHWLRPEPMHAKIAGLHLHDKRFWSVEGIFNSGFIASAQINYDGNDPSLDSDFITNSEDSIIVMYRAHADSEWVIADSFTLQTGGNPNDKIGSIFINHLRKGQYCLAIWNTAVPDTTQAETECSVTSIQNQPTQNEFQLFPNPANHQVDIRFEKNIFNRLQVTNLSGRVEREMEILTGQTTLQFSTAGLPDGIYLVTLTGKNNFRISKKLVKQ